MIPKRSQSDPIHLYKNWNTLDKCAYLEKNLLSPKATTQWSRCDPNLAQKLSGSLPCSWPWHSQGTLDAPETSLRNLYFFKISIVGPQQARKYMHHLWHVRLSDTEIVQIKFQIHPHMLKVTSNSSKGLQVAERRRLEVPRRES